MEGPRDGEVKRWSVAEISVADGGRKVESYHHGSFHVCGCAFHRQFFSWSLTVLTRNISNI
jgi:hypothetical protein